MNKLPNGWTQSTFEECLQYEQPTKYIVKSTKYNNNYKTPVLTAGKSFILGYTNETDGIFTQTPVIIFDDFTTDTKFVDFHFKVKSSAMKILRPNGKADIKFLYYLMQIIYHRSDTHKRYWISEYSKIKIPLPPLETQKQIAERLDFLFDKIDKALQLLNENKEYIKKYRLSILKDAFECKLTRPSKNWEIKTLGEVCEINPKNKLDDNLEVSFIPMNLILDKFQNKFSYEIKKWKDIKKGYTHLQNNCIALAKITPCFENGKCVILRNLKNGYGAGTTELIILLPNSKKILIEYIFYFMNTQYFMEQGKRNFKGSVGQLRIGTDFITNFKIPIPPLEIQKEIVSILDEKFKAMEEIERLNNENIENLLLLKKSLLKDAFGGRL